MPSKFMLKGNCLLHPSCRASVTINMVDLCYECWNKASGETRDKIVRATSNWSRGLYTQEDLEDTLTYIVMDDPAICASQEPEVHYPSGPGGTPTTFNSEYEATG